MKQLTNLNSKYERLQKDLEYSIECFNKGNDKLGLNALLYFIENLENILNTFCYLNEFMPNIDKLLKALQTLLICIKNKDIIGMVDTLELVIYPLTEEWCKEELE